VCERKKEGGGGKGYERRKGKGEGEITNVLTWNSLYINMYVNRYLGTHINRCIGMYKSTPAFIFSPAEVARKRLDE
jgi:hypothetical protein